MILFGLVVLIFKSCSRSNKGHAFQRICGLNTCMFFFFFLFSFFLLSKTNAEKCFQKQQLFDERKEGQRNETS